MPWGAVAGAAIVAGGSYLANQSASDAASAQANSLREQGNIEYARAQEAAGRVPEFRPVTVSTRFGTPKYTYDDSGRLTGVSYTPSEQLLGFQDRTLGLTGQYLTAAEQAAQQQQLLQGAQQAYGGGGQLFGLGQQALPTTYDVTGKTQEYYNRMQQLVAPERERQLATTRQGLFNTGRTGLATGATQAGGMLATNPEMAAYYNAIAQQDLQLAANAEQQARANLQQDISTGTNLFKTGAGMYGLGGELTGQQYQNYIASMAPYTTALSGAYSQEQMAQQPVALGMQYGGNVTNQANAIADAYLRASGAGSASQIAAINAQAQADAYNPWAGALMGAGQAIGGTNWGSLFSSAPASSAGTSSFNQGAVNYGSGTQQFGAPASGWSYGGFNTSGRLY